MPNRSIYCLVGDKKRGPIPMEKMPIFPLLPLLSFSTYLWWQNEKVLVWVYVVYTDRMTWKNSVIQMCLVGVAIAAVTIWKWFSVRKERDDDNETEFQYWRERDQDQHWKRSLSLWAALVSHDPLDSAEPPKPEQPGIVVAMTRSDQVLWLWEKYNRTT